MATQEPTTKKRARAPKPAHGGDRVGSGRPRIRDRRSMAKPTWVGLTAAERAEFERKAAERELSLSGYIRELLGLAPFEEQQRPAVKKRGR